MFHFNAIYLFATNPSWCLTSPHIPVISFTTPLLLALGPPAGEALPATTHGGSKRSAQENSSDQKHKPKSMAAIRFKSMQSWILIHWWENFRNWELEPNWSRTNHWLPGTRNAHPRHVTTIWMWIPWPLQAHELPRATNKWIKLDNTVIRCNKLG